MATISPANPSGRIAKRGVVTVVVGVSAFLLMFYGTLASGFGLNPPEHTVLPRLAFTIGILLLAAVPAIVWRKDMLVTGLAVLAGLIIWVTLVAG